MGFDDPKTSLGPKETGARAALPIWLEFMEQANKGAPVENFPNVTPLEELAKTAHENVDVPDAAPPADVTEQGLPEKQPAEPAKPPVKPTTKPGVPQATPSTPPPHSGFGG